VNPPHNPQQRCSVASSDVTVSNHMFQALLKEVVDGVDGGLATLVMDFEGIAFDTYAKPNPPVEFDIQTIGAEFSVVLKAIQRASQMLEAGDPTEVTVNAGKVTTIMRVINETYFVALTLTPDSNVGKGRYLLRTRIPALLKELT
jgi:predicted regulator of Ras-like GTPase activity (Roadblock/LC7/MglB family)